MPTQEQEQWASQFTGVNVAPSGSGSGGLPTMQQSEQQMKDADSGPRSNGPFQAPPAGADDTAGGVNSPAEHKSEPAPVYHTMSDGPLSNPPPDTAPTEQQMKDADSGPRSNGPFQGPPAGADDTAGGVNSPAEHKSEPAPVYHTMSDGPLSNPPPDTAPTEQQMKDADSGPRSNGPFQGPPAGADDTAGGVNSPAEHKSEPAPVYHTMSDGPLSNPPPDTAPTEQQMKDADSGPRSNGPFQAPPAGADDTAGGVNSPTPGAEPCSDDAGDDESSADDDDGGDSGSADDGVGVGEGDDDDGGDSSSSDDGVDGEAEDGDDDSSDSGSADDGVGVGEGDDDDGGDSSSSDDGVDGEAEDGDDDSSDSGSADDGAGEGEDGDSGAGSPTGDESAEVSPGDGGGNEDGGYSSGDGGGGSSAEGSSDHENGGDGG